MARGLGAGRQQLKGARSPRIAATITGAILGGLIWIALDAAGIGDALKAGYLLAPAIAVGAVLGGTRLRPMLWAVSGVLLVLLLIAAYTPLAPALIAPLVRSDALPNEKLDAVAVLSGGMTADGRMGNETLDRLLTGAALLRTGAADALILSRERLEKGSLNVSDSADQREILTLTGVNVPVYFADSVTSTRVEALRMRAIARSRGWSRIALVTSPLHSRRACATFEAVGFAVTCIPSASRDISVRNFAGPGDRLEAFRGWLYEMAGTAKYRAAGWIH